MPVGAHASVMWGCHSLTEDNTGSGQEVREGERGTDAQASFRDDTRGPAGFYIPDRVTDHPRALEIQTQVVSCRQDHAGAGLAPLMLLCVRLYTPIWVIRTDIEPFDQGSSMIVEERSKSFIGLLDVIEGSNATGDESLVADDDQGISGAREGDGRFKHIWEQTHIQGIAEVSRGGTDLGPGKGGVLNQGVVTVKKDGRSHVGIMGHPNRWGDAGRREWCV